MLQYTTSYEWVSQHLPVVLDTVVANSKRRSALDCALQQPRIVWLRTRQPFAPQVPFTFSSQAPAPDAGHLCSYAHAPSVPQPPSCW